MCQERDTDVYGNITKIQSNDKIQTNASSCSRGGMADPNVVMPMIKSSLTSTRRGSDNPDKRNYLYSPRIQDRGAILSYCGKVFRVHGGEDAEVDVGHSVGWAGLTALSG